MNPLRPPIFAWTPGEFNDPDTQFASIYSNSYYLNDQCPSELKNALNSCQKSIYNNVLASMDARVNPFSDVLKRTIPEHVLNEYESIKKEITERVIESHEKPTDHEFLATLCSYLLKLSKNRLNLNNQEVLEKYGDYIGFHPFTKNGRLTVTNKAFPILTLKKEERINIVPHNHFFLELDFNGAEVRTLFASAGLSQPENDIYKFISDEVYDGTMNRDEVKKNVIVTFYRGNSDLGRLGKLVDIEALKSKFFFGDHLITPFGRKIMCDEEHFMNYLGQSASSYNFFIQMMKMQDLLKYTKSFVAFPQHDSLIIDFHEDDLGFSRQILESFQDTVLGKFLINKKMGYDFFNMVKI